MMVRQRDLVQGLLALVVAAACSGASGVGTINATPSPAAQASPTPSSPTADAVLDDRFGFLIQKNNASEAIPGPVGLKVRRESDPTPLYTLHTGTTYGVKVSPEGRRIAYWSGQELRVIDLSPTARPLTLLKLTSKESSFQVVWSSDGTGLLIGVHGAGGSFANPVPGYTAIRVVDAAGGGLRQIVRIANADVEPLGWDRTAHLIAAHEFTLKGTRYFDTVTEGGLLKRVRSISEIHFPQASDNAQWVFGRGLINSTPPFGTTLLRVWPTASFADGVDLRSEGEGLILVQEWRPGTAEIGVLFADRLELWTPSGTRRTFALPEFLAAPNALSVLRFRADGKVAFIDRANSTDGVYAKGAAVAIDLASGVIVDIDWTPVNLVGTSVRIDT
jgi:hypothetical protein